METDLQHVAEKFFFRVLLVSHVLIFWLKPNVNCNSVKYTNLCVIRECLFQGYRGPEKVHVHDTSTV